MSFLYLIVQNNFFLSKLCHFQTYSSLQIIFSEYTEQHRLQNEFLADLTDNLPLLGNSSTYGFLS